mgnify:CR=1 FL=1
MKTIPKWMAATLALALTASLSIISTLAISAAESFADFRIDASAMDAPDRTISVDWYRRGEDGSFHPADVAADYDYTLNRKVNRVTGDATFYIQPKTDGVWVTVDYLTDVNGDGFYELLEGGDDPVWDTLTAQGRLTQGGKENLTVAQTYILSAETLTKRFDETERARAQLLAVETPVTSWPLCRVTLGRTDPADGQTYEQLYYLEIFGSELLPWDILRSAPYRDAVEYGLTWGWFTGLEDGSFGPSQPLNRAQLAQVLWSVGGGQETEQASFTDAKPGDWYYPAVCWCQQKGLIAGYEDGSFLPDAPLTREQMAAFLHRYSRLSGGDRTNPYFSPDLSRYDDGEDVSPWALESMRWAVSSRLLTASGNLLRPGDTATRAELAQALYALKVPQLSSNIMSPMW